MGKRDRMAEQVKASMAGLVKPDTAPMPAELSRPGKWDARMSLTLASGAKRALEQARETDGIDSTARIRAMIELWQESSRFRAQVDKRARFLA
jgi:hypothetical protein